MVVLLAFGRPSRHQLGARRFFQPVESNPRAVPTSLLDRPAVSISRAASALVFV
jgi:hypothetical protein